MRRAVSETRILGAAARDERPPRPRRGGRTSPTATDAISTLAKRTPKPVFRVHAGADGSAHPSSVLVYSLQEVRDWQALPARHPLPGVGWAQKEGRSTRN